MSSERIRHEKKLFKRLLLTSDDLDHARAFADILLSENYDSRELRRSLQTSLVVAYWRPFTNNDGSRDAAVTLPTKKFCSSFSDNNWKTHEHIKKLRNTVMAHSDSSVYGISVTIREMVDEKIAWSIKWNPWAPMDKSTLNGISDNINKVRAKVCEEMLRIQALLPAGERF